MSKAAYGYQRVSSKGQLDGHGLDRQKDTIQAWADKNDIEIVEWFEDSISGTTPILQREGFQSAIIAMGSNGIKTLIIERMDRLGRDALVSMSALPYLASKGITLIAADTGQDLTAVIQEDPMQKALIQIQAVIAELEKAMLVKKLKAARARKKAETGRCEGQKPYGSYEGEMPIIALIKHLRRTKAPSGKLLSLAKVAERLNALEVPTRGGGLWRPSVVGQIEKGPYWKDIRVADYREEVDRMMGRV